MLTMSYEQARELRDLLGRIDDDEEGTLRLDKIGLGADLSVGFDDGQFEISGGGTVERVDGADFEPSPDPNWMNP